MPDLIKYTSKGLYCSQADLYIDPIRPVDKAIISHANRACIGNRHYMSHNKSIPFIKRLIGFYANIQGMEYGQCVFINGVSISLHPSGHIPGSSQVRLEYKGEVWVVSGDYKNVDDKISEPLEALSCHTFVSEAHYGLPFFNWPTSNAIFDEIDEWWRSNADNGIHSILIASSLGKAQRILKSLNRNNGFIYVGEEISAMNMLYQGIGIDLPDTLPFDQLKSNNPDFRGLSIVSPSTLGSSYGLRKLEPYSVGMASGVMSIDLIRRQNHIDRGFILSDHADWVGLNTVIRETGAERILINQGQSVFYSKWLRSNGINAQELTSMYQGNWAQNAPKAYMYA